MEHIQTSTPLIFGKYIPPPPRRLWSVDSPTEQLYRNKWTKYRNAACENDPWSSLDSPRFVDFKDLPDVQDDCCFDEEENNSTPQRFQAHEGLRGVDWENNNILEDLKKCTLSAIKPMEKIGDCDIDESSVFGETVKAIPDKLLSPKKNIFSNIEENREKPIAETTEYLEGDGKNHVDGKFATESKDVKKPRTIVKPFTFENREKFRQEHTRARRDRDSIGKELRKGFRATPIPNFLKVHREKVATKAKIVETRSNNDAKKIKKNTEEILKKKTFPCGNLRKLSIVPKPPNLLTAIRATERQRFEEHLRKKELEREELKKKEEAARKKKEEEEIAELRRKLVHKAQPIRKYKMFVPKMKKRELSDPTVPTACKRQRNF